MNYLVEILMFTAKCLVAYVFLCALIHVAIDHFHKCKSEFLLSLSQEIQKAFSSFQPKI